MNKTLTELLGRLRARGYRLTPQRSHIIEVFLDNPDSHLSAEEAYDLVREEHPDMGLATVYRTLDLLAQLGVLQRMNFGDGKDRYELAEGVHHHHHLICSECGKVCEFGEDLLDHLERTIAQESNFRIFDHEVKFYGICYECRQAAQETEK